MRGMDMNQSRREELMLVQVEAMVKAGKKVSGTDSETVPDSAFFPYLAPNPERHKQE